MPTNMSAQLLYSIWWCTSWCPGSTTIFQSTSWALLSHPAVWGTESSSSSFCVMPFCTAGENSLRLASCNLPLQRCRNSWTHVPLWTKNLNNFRRELSQSEDRFKWQTPRLMQMRLVIHLPLTRNREVDISKMKQILRISKWVLRSGLKQIWGDNTDTLDYFTQDSCP